MAKYEYPENVFGNQRVDSLIKTGSLPEFAKRGGPPATGRRAPKGRRWLREAERQFGEVHPFQFHGGWGVEMATFLRHGRAWGKFEELDTAYASLVADTTTLLGGAPYEKKDPLVYEGIVLKVKRVSEAYRERVLWRWEQLLDCFDAFARDLFKWLEKAGLWASGGPIDDTVAVDAYEWWMKFTSGAPLRGRAAAPLIEERDALMSKAQTDDDRRMMYAFVAAALLERRDIPMWRDVIPPLRPVPIKRGKNSHKDNYPWLLDRIQRVMGEKPGLSKMAVAGEVATAYSEALLAQFEDFYDRAWVEEHEEERRGRPIELISPRQVMRIWDGAREERS